MAQNLDGGPVFRLYLEILENSLISQVHLPSQHDVLLKPKTIFCRHCELAILGYHWFVDMVCMGYGIFL